MADSEPASLAVQIANQFINTANEKLQKGQRADVIAAAMRNAAANFTAFSEAHARGAVDVEAIVTEFRQMLDYYAEVHSEPARPATGLEQLIEQVKTE